MHCSRLKMEKKTRKGLKRFNLAPLQLHALLYSFLLDDLLTKGSMPAVFFTNHFWLV